MRFSATEWKEFLEIGTRESSFDWDIPCGYITFGTCGMSIAKIIKKKWMRKFVNEKMDCEFFLGFGNRMEKYLWAGSVAFQIECMKSIWDSFPADGKPEWLTVEQIENYERRMAE